MKPDRKYFLAVLILALSLLLAACAQGGAPAVTVQSQPATVPPAAPTAVPTLAPAAAPTAVPTSEPVTAPTQPPAGGQSLTFTDGLSRTVTLAGPAQRIVSMAPSNTEILFAVGAGQQVVGRDDFSDYPPQAAQIPSIGGSLGKYNLEAIVAQKPDLVLASELNTVDQVKALEDLGLTVYYLKNPSDLDGMYHNLEIVAQLSGHAAEAQQLVASLQARVEAVTSKTASLPDASRPLVFYEIDSTDPSAPYTSGPGTFIDQLLTLAGGKNLGSVLKDAYAQISLEELLVKNPKFILLGDYTWGGVKPEDVGKRAGWDKLAAVADGKVYPFDDNTVSRPGPRLVDGLEALAKLLHPELFK